MPAYRLIFPLPADVSVGDQPTAHIDTGDKLLEVGDVVEHGGERWRVSEAPLEQPESGETADVMVWPAK
jgi:hypothetical protein